MSRSKSLIAIVDDDESACRALERLLRSAGLEAETFTSGTEFIQSIKARRPDCVVLDLHMPEMSGFDVQARLKESGLHLPVIIITGHDSPETRERALTMGPSAYLRKPVDGETLLDAIAVAIASEAA